jgi:Fe2+ or Zn2+ uptake regulation protein
VNDVDDVVVAALREAGRKITPQRLEVARLLAAAEGPVSQAELAEAARESSPFLDYSTVVRTLRVLETLGLASETRAEKGRYVYAWSSVGKIEQPVDGEADHV